MRCLTLADALREKGVTCHFLTRPLEGHLIDVVRKRGHHSHQLQLSQSPLEDAANMASPNANIQTKHISWLGASLDQDALECIDILAQIQPDWLVVDHYAIDAAWETLMKPHCRKVMIIDDLADRSHECDFLLDQTFGRDPMDYQQKVPPKCTIYCGAQFAILRREFSLRRQYSLSRRNPPSLKKLMINMGGIDSKNITSRVLDALQTSPLPTGCEIYVVAGINAPWLEAIETKAAAMPWRTTVLVDVQDMAQLMSDSDLAIGGAGATSWERCCLGMPTIMIVLADNQRVAAANMAQAGVALCLEATNNLDADICTMIGKIVGEPQIMSRMTSCAQNITNGEGYIQVIDKLFHLQ
jgi:UDP-2,4-diacetamido-2,4,6-trideoxy-beta-L-altropyranose hydrolase